MWTRFASVVVPLQTVGLVGGVIVGAAGHGYRKMVWRHLDNRLRHFLQ